MSKYGVTPDKEQELRKQMERLGVREADLEEQFVRSPGPGGQKVNKSSTCVVLRHLPSGTLVKVSQARSQALNRFLARRLLCERLQEAQSGGSSPRSVERARVRKQKQHRKRRSRKDGNGDSDDV